MVKVNLWAGLTAFTGGDRQVEVDARNVGQMLDALAAKYPGLGAVIGEGVSVSIDGEIFPDNRSEPVQEDQDIYLMQRVRGG